MPQSWSRDEIYYIAERGYRLYSEGQLHQAAILFEGLIAIDPENAYCRKALGTLGIALGQYRQAVVHLAVAIARDRMDADALAARCEALMAMGDLAAAQRDLASLAVLADGAEHARRLKLQFLHQSGLAANSPEPPQLPLLVQR
jgi:tetratricopeptide (TPR) repeat protein